MIDLHSHILRGLDDGAQTMEESLDIARGAVASGVAVIAATPHVREDWPTDVGVMEYRVAELRAELEERQVALEVRPGGEIAIEWLETLTADELRRFGLGGNPRYLLVETPYYGWPPVLLQRLGSLLAVGTTPVLAHPERNAVVQGRPDRLAPLVDAGVLVQVTAASVDGRLGKRARDCARVLIDRGLAHMLASDAHGASVRDVGMASAVRALGSDALATWLTQDVPSAILDDTEIPPRPPVRRWRGWTRALRGG